MGMVLLFVVLAEGGGGVGRSPEHVVWPMQSPPLVFRGQGGTPWGLGEKRLLVVSVGLSSPLGKSDFRWGAKLADPQELH